MVTKRTSGLPLICLICGDDARGINFDVMTCMSCKTFFRRHAIKSKFNLRCQVESNCKMTKRTRGNCSACRLKKCFQLGMNPKLVGNRFSNRSKSKYTQHSNKGKNQLPQPLPLNLLQNDRSTLTTNEWNLLSNIIHAYDAINIIPQTKYLLEQQLSLPPKIRSKPSATFDIIKLFFAVFQPLVERTPYFHDLSIDSCQTLVRNNSRVFGSINSVFIMREVNALDYPAFLTGCNTVYGPEQMGYHNRFSIRLEKNGTFIKIMFFILGFSTNCGVVVLDGSENMTSISDSISIVNVQNVFITMFWKYLVYQYGFIVAVQWFNSFIKYVLDILQSLNDQSNVRHCDMVDTVIEETTRLLTIED